MSDSAIKLIGTSPRYVRAAPPKDYFDQLRRTVLAAGTNKWEAILIYTGLTMPDPWIVAQAMLTYTHSVLPLVALQPLYSHPIHVANQILTLSMLFNKRIVLNVVAGGNPRDMQGFGDTLDHDQRYDRITEYVSIIKALLRSGTPTSFSGRYYQIHHAQLERPLPAALMPGWMVSGSSPAGTRAARILEARAIHYLKPASSYGRSVLPDDLDHGVRLGVIVRESSQQAWAEAHRMFPPNAAGRAIRASFAQMSDSHWVRDLGACVEAQEESPYWLRPYQENYTNCPYLVGSFADVAAALQSYYDAGIRTFLLERPQNETDYARITNAFKMVRLA